MLAENVPAEEVPAENVPAEEMPAEVEGQSNQSGSSNEEQNVTFGLPGYCRSPNTSNSCLVYGCRNNTRHRIPKSLKVQLLLNNNYYISPYTRVCREHLEDNDWDVIFTAENRCFDFNPQQVIEMMEWLKQPSYIIDFENLQEQHSEELHYWTGRSLDEFQIIYDETPSLAESCRKSKTALGIFLSKIRTGESNERLGTFFHMVRSNLERLMKIARECLERDFVPRYLGFNHMTRQQIIERTLAVPGAVFGNSGEAIIICDGTYMYIQKSANFSFQKITYSLQKHRNLLKPFLFVTCDGHIVDISGPHAAIENDASILNHHLSGVDRPLNWLLNPGDVFILDRGFRDSIEYLEEHGYVGIMPQSQTRGSTQLTTIQANKSRMCTICRWPVEIVNGRLKRDFKIFRHEFCNISMPHFFADLRIAAALTNAFHLDLIDNPQARDFINIAQERLNMNNNLADYTDFKRLHRNRVVFSNINVEQNNLNIFPVLTAEELTLFAVGTYQIKLAPSYYSEHIRSTGTFVIQQYNRSLIDLTTYNMSNNNVHLLKMNIKSRHLSSKMYHCYILVDANNSGLEAIKNYCCTCFTGRRTIGCCAHTMCLVWFIGFARHQDAIRCPALFLDTIIIDNDEDD